jgi:antitoxin ParD1/3/4
MNVSLTPKLRQFVQSKIGSGNYSSASDVMRDALRLMSERDARYQLQLKALRKALADGEQSGPAIEWDFEKFMKSLSRRRTRSRR